MKYKTMKLVFVIAMTMCIVPAIFAGKPQLHKLKLPKGFHISVYAAKVPDARSLALGPNNIVFVGSRQAGRVYALIPNKNATKAREVKIVAKKLDTPNGVAVYNGDLYVAEKTRILKFANIAQQLNKLAKPTYIRADLPDKWLHGWRTIHFGPNGLLYIAIGAPCNVCLLKDNRLASISRMKPDGSNFEVYARGVRNSVGFDWDPLSGDLWFTDNGRDWMGDNTPPDELNHATKIGLNFGFPYYHGNGIPDPEFGKSKPKSDFTWPAIELGPHVAALGMTFYRGDQFPAEYKNQIFIAEHGSWNRSKKIGYRVVLVRRNGEKPVKYEPFITGWLSGQSIWGRPVDILEMPDGSLLISDDFAGLVYRVTFDLNPPPNVSNSVQVIATSS